MNVDLYLRVSKGTQDEQNQLPSCEAICQRRGWSHGPPVVDVMSGKDQHRPGWSHVMGRARLGVIGAVVVWSLDRIGRDRVSVAQDLRDLLRWGVQVVSIQESWTDQAKGPLGSLLLDVVTWFAEQERRKIIDRTNEGLAPIRRAIANGGTWTGRKSGRVITRLGRPSIYVDIDRACTLLSEGHSLSEVSRRLGMARGTISKALGRSEKGAPVSAPVPKQNGHVATARPHRK